MTSHEPWKEKDADSMLFQRKTWLDTILERSPPSDSKLVDRDQRDLRVVKKDEVSQAACLDSAISLPLPLPWIEQVPPAAHESLSGQKHLDQHEPSVRHTSAASQGSNRWARGSVDASSGGSWPVP